MSGWAAVRRFLPLPRVLLVIAIAATTIGTRLTPSSMGLPPGAVPSGLFLVIAGLLLIAWALLRLGVGMLGGVETLATDLVTNGPYRWVRHPVYVGMGLALVGYAVAARSWPGLVLVLAVFVPAAVYRASREEAALARTFPVAWAAYRRRTGAVLPRLSRRHQS